MVHEEKVAAVRRANEKPDRVFGLRKTARFAKLLKERTRTGKNIEEVLQASPFRQEAAALIFPFLVVEAKSEKGDSCLSRTQLQTASSIMTLLRLQQNLASVEKHVSSPLTPVVWFLSNKGEHWNVAVGFLESTRPTSSAVSASTHVRARH